jgi:hypothetical protein
MVLMLQENLVDNGGLLDRVHFISRVRHQEDADFLNTIVDSNPRYTCRDFGMMEGWNFTAQWDHDIEPNTLYVKIGTPPPLLSPRGSHSL